MNYPTRLIPQPYFKRINVREIQNQGYLLGQQKIETL